MNLIERLINQGFWLNDTLRKQAVKQHLNELSEVLDMKPRSETIRQANVKRLLEHAISSTEFYRNNKNFHDLNDFPVIDKNIIRENLESFRSSIFPVEELRQVSTSGSTGTPFKVWQDKSKIQRNQADNIYFLRRVNFPLGGRIYFLRVWNEINRLSPLTQLARNIRPVEASDLSEPKTLQFLEDLRKDTSRKAVLAYSSTLEALVANMEKLGITMADCRVSTIFTMSEALSDLTRQKLRNLFRCPVYSRYSNAENGFLAHQCFDNSTDYLMNVGSYVFEFLHPDRDEPVAPGEPGRVVVTDLFNFGMPMIRYDTGDIAVMAQRPHGQVIKRIEGRKLDFIYSVDGKRLSPHSIDYAIRRFDLVKQFQFIQTGEGLYTLKLNSENLPEPAEEKIVHRLKEYLGAEARIQVEYVNEIPLLDSGKRKIVVNEMVRG